MCTYALRQIQLHDITLLAAQLSFADWQRLLDTPETAGGAWWMLPALALTEQYYPGTFAPEVLAEFAARCPPLLRHRAMRTTLTQVSWSNLRIAAFPGIHWSRSPLEALRFARTRIFPNRVALDELVSAPLRSPLSNKSAGTASRTSAEFCAGPCAGPRAQTVMSLRPRSPPATRRSMREFVVQREKTRLRVDGIFGHGARLCGERQLLTLGLIAQQGFDARSQRCCIAGRYRNRGSTTSIGEITDSLFDGRDAATAASSTTSGPVSCSDEMTFSSRAPPSAAWRPA